MIQTGDELVLRTDEWLKEDGSAGDRKIRARVRSILLAGAVRQAGTWIPVLLASGEWIYVRLRSLTRYEEPNR
jgi:hypothetical protein